MKKVILKPTTERGFPEWVVCDYFDQEEWIGAFREREDIIAFCRSRNFEVYIKVCIRLEAMKGDEYGFTISRV